MALIPYRAGTSVLSWVFSFTTLSLPLNSVASLSTDGPIARHGAHHSAQKSTSTGTWLWRTADSQVLSVTSRALLMVGGVRVGDGGLRGRGNMASTPAEIHSRPDLEGGKALRATGAAGPSRRLRRRSRPARAPREARRRRARPARRSRYPPGARAAAAGGSPRAGLPARP